MRKYFGLVLLFWSIYIILNAVMDSIIWHQGMFWYQNLVLWHWLKPFAILALFMTGWFSLRLYYRIDADFPHWNYGPATWQENTNLVPKKIRQRRILTIAFFIFYGLLWRWVWFEHFIDWFAGRR